jgi:hypothetical protein
MIIISILTNQRRKKIKEIDQSKIQLEEVMLLIDDTETVEDDIRIKKENNKKKIKNKS